MTAPWHLPWLGHGSPRRNGEQDGTGGEIPDTRNGHRRQRFDGETHEQVRRSPDEVDRREREQDFRAGLAHRQRKKRRATPKLSTSHVVTMANSGRSCAQPSPWIMMPRTESTTAVSGSAWMMGCTASGKLPAEKKTPDATHMGSMSRFMRPDAASIVLAREATSRPNDPKTSAPSRHATPNATSDPRIGTPKAKYPNDAITVTSITISPSRITRKDAR